MKELMKKKHKGDVLSGLNYSLPCSVWVFIPSLSSPAWGIMFALRTLRNAKFYYLLGDKNKKKNNKNIDYVWLDGQNGCHWVWRVCVDRQGIVLLQQGAVLGPLGFALSSVYLAGAVGLGAGPTHVNQTNPYMAGLRVKPVLQVSQQLLLKL